MGCSDIKVTVLGSAQGIQELIKQAKDAIADSESARDEAFNARDDSDKHAKESLKSAQDSQSSADQAKESARLAKLSEQKAKESETNAETYKVGASGAMAQAKVYRDQAKQYASERVPVTIKDEGVAVGTGLLELNFVGNGVVVTKVKENCYKVTVSAPQVTVSWDSITSKPSTFTPSAHNHAIADVTDLQTALDEKQPKGRYATVAQLGDKLDTSKYTSDKSNFAKLDTANTFTQGVTLSAKSTAIVDGTEDTDIANVRTVKNLIAQQAQTQALADSKLRTRVQDLESRETVSIALSSDDGDKTITMKLIVNGSTVAIGMVDISGMFTNNQTPAVKKTVYCGFTDSKAVDEAFIKKLASVDTAKLNGLVLDFKRNANVPKYLIAWIPTSLGTVQGFSSSGFLDVWTKTALSVDGEDGFYYVSDNMTKTNDISYEVK